MHLHDCFFHIHALMQHGFLNRSSSLLSIRMKSLRWISEVVGHPPPPPASLTGTNRTPSPWMQMVPFDGCAGLSKTPAFWSLGVVCRSGLGAV